MVFLMESSRTLRGYPVAGFLLGLLFDSEDGSNVFLQNVRLSLSYVVV
jgi:hypothetical protein